MSKDLEKIIALTKQYMEVSKTIDLVGVNSDGECQITVEMFNVYSEGKEVSISNRKLNEYPFEKSFIQDGIKIYCITNQK